MTSLDINAIRRFANDSVKARLANIEAFAEIDSTNTYLMRKPGPAPGTVNLAVTNNQTAGRGRHGKSWLSPPGTGLCMSVAYTFASRPDNLPALTLALGLAAIDALQELGASNLELKWPNDLVAMDGKLGGILTEVQNQSGTEVTVVAGLGINIDLPGKLDFGLESDWARRTVDLKSVGVALTSHEELAGRMATYLLQAFADYEKSGFAAVAERWSRYDWLLGREITVDTGQTQFSGIGAGVADDGALLIDTPESGIRHISSGTIVIAGSRKPRQ
ncbi:MAG: biotin--[acetyl-CoA-carboxylase] ligase [Gammaproteobacteria bacterium]|nr:biotin--[acetyl-CoA-carboxylase] ligase [Gammaproteobacteria bacterium]